MTWACFGASAFWFLFAAILSPWMPTVADVFSYAGMFLLGSGVAVAIAEAW